MPNVKKVLDSLHSSESPHAGQGTGEDGEENVVRETGLMLFESKKTQAYNDLLRVCTYGDESDTQDLFDVLDEMDNHDVEKDQETFYNIQQAWQNTGAVFTNKNT